MIEPRIYRAAFIPALLAFVVAMFSLQSPPQAVQQALAADVLFDGRVALNAARRLAEAQPDRRPGTAGDRAVARQVARGLRSEDFPVTIDHFRDRGRDLVNVVARRTGASTRQIVVVAGRDADRVPDLAGSAADTAALLEIARTLEGRATRKTVVLASVDGSTTGSAGARRLAGQLASHGPVEAVLVVSNSAVGNSDASLLVPWSETTLRTGVRLQRTVGDSLRLELPSGGAGRTAGSPGQFVRLAFPLGIGDQAPFLDAGFDAIRVSGSGELPPDGQPEPDVDRLGATGRGALRTVFAYDASDPVATEPASYMLVGQQRLPRWAVTVLVAALLLPLLASSIDAFARARRRREPVLPWLRWIGTATLPLLVTLAVAEFLVLVGVAPDAPPVPLPPGAFELDGSAWVALGVCAAFFVATLLLARLRLSERLDAGRPGAGTALALVLCVVSVAVWAVNPFAALALLPAFHVWLLVTASPVPASRPVGAALVLAGALPPLLIVLGVLARLSLGVWDGIWYGFLLVTGHHVGLYSVLVGMLLAVSFVAALRIALARGPQPEPARSGRR